MSVAPTVQQGQSLRTHTHIHTHTHTHTGPYTCTLVHILSMQIVQLSDIFTIFFRLYLFSSHIHSHSQKQPFAFSSDIIPEPWPTYVIPPPSLLHNIFWNSKQNTAHKIWKHWLGYCYFGGCNTSLLSLQSWTKRQWLTHFFLFFLWLWTIIKYHLIPSQHESTWWHRLRRLSVFTGA